MTYAMDGKELTKLVRLTFDNTRAPDVQSVVLPYYRDQIGEADGLLKKLKVEKDKGIPSSEVKPRRDAFGENKVEEEPQDPLWKLMWEALQDPTLIFLTCAAMFSLFIAVFVEQSAYGWLEGVAILFAVFVVVTVGAVNDYQKEAQFRELNAKKDDVPITVLRDGSTSKVSTFDLVVGDIVLLSTGDILPADGVIIGRNDLEINEKMLTGETVMKKKSASYVILDDSIKSSPTLFAGTFVQAGEGRMVVVAVGQHTYQGTMEEKMKEAETGRSILQKKLDAMTDLITTVSMYVSILLVIILCLRMGYAFYTKQCCMESWDHKVHWSELLGFVITGITIFVVAVPEGLPLAVTIALAFSVKKMLKDNNLVRHLSACETMGGATTICSDKTGTLTTSRMTVVKMWAADKVYNKVEDANALKADLRQRICEAGVINTLFKTYLKRDSPTSAPVYCGNDTECALLVLSEHLGFPYDKVRTQYPDQEPNRRCFTFSSDRKRMSTLVPYDGAYTAFVKGAAEIVSGLCVNYVNSSNATSPLDAETMKRVQQAISDFADEGLRTICIASKKIEKSADLTALSVEEVWTCC
jgi:calcium-translocating P-type ATPase